MVHSNHAQVKWDSLSRKETILWLLLPLLGEEPLSGESDISWKTSGVEL
jgi:hypothetical protein